MSPLGYLEKLRVMIAGGVGAVAAEQVRPTDMPPDACQEVIDRCCALGSDNPHFA